MRFAGFFAPPLATGGKTDIARSTVASRLLRVAPSRACSDIPVMIVEKKSASAPASVPAGTRDRSAERYKETA